MPLVTREDNAGNNNQPVAAASGSHPLLMMPTTSSGIPSSFSGTSMESSMLPGEIFSALIPKLPPFWREEPEIWFLQIKSSFNLAGISQDSTKFEYLPSHLDKSILYVVKDIIRSPPAQGRYRAMKPRIIQHFTESEESQLKQLLNNLELGDQKPSHLTHRIKSLAGSKVSDNVLRTLFLERLPEKFKCILAVTEAAQLDKLSNLADKSFEQFSPTSMSIAELGQKNVRSDLPRPVASSLSELPDLLPKLDSIISRIEAIENRTRASHRVNSSRHRSSQSRSKSRNSKDLGLCWYHWRFAEKATKCLQPCAFKNSKN
ncbi:uncharacterized protein LOC118749049 [Rhagoletis pomonella]|uniref:uncharacterized protein LOC118749049 n=1 Tax=Rhagoletis pomonella TaxID=28610 RepID=UPI00177CBDB2|nr:uncharacterized protein LOC118749049 [Rhagoletis pomonella]